MPRETEAEQDDISADMAGKNAGGNAVLRKVEELSLPQVRDTWCSI